jgi:hypothetical protein
MQRRSCLLQGERFGQIGQWRCVGAANGERHTWQVLLTEQVGSRLGLQIRGLRVAHQDVFQITRQQR